MDITVKLDSDEDLPSDYSFDSRDEAENFMTMMQGTIESLMDEADYIQGSGDVAIRMDANVEGRRSIFSLNDKRWCILCHNCYNIVARDRDAQVARDIFNDHVDAETNTCIERSNRTILNSFSKLEKMRDAMRGGS